jgi:hypothetical protein
MIVKQQKSLERISGIFAWFTRKIEADNALGLFDINRISEDILIPLLSAVYGYKNLKNLNEDGENYPGIDLGDRLARVAYQITSETGGQKVSKTLQIFCDNNYYTDFGRLIIYIITKKQRSYKGSDWDDITRGKIDFNKKRDIQDFSDLLGDIKRLPLEQILKVEEILDQYFREVNIGDLENILLRHVEVQLRKEKQSRKYIPDIFVEIPHIKDKARYFSHPSLFLGKILEEVTRLDLNNINRVLQKLELPLLSFKWVFRTEEEFPLEDVDGVVALAKAELLNLQEQLRPYAYWKGTETEIETLVPPTKRYVADSMKYYLGNYASSVSYKIDNLIEKLSTVSASILFITARAGQGKTNFVCDFAETFLAKRSIPCVFFTGRDFNYVLPENITEHFVKSLYSGSTITTNEGLGLLDRLGMRLDKPLVVIIDGINEHTNVQAFSYHLEIFAANLQNYKNIKLILTCRTEYFEERFSNFERSSFHQNIKFVNDPERNWSNVHKGYLLDGYFRFFRIQAPFISRRAAEVLENDTLLLRMFCEVHGNVDASEDIRVSPITNIYRDKVFRQYLNSKIQGAVSQSGNEARISVRPDGKYLRLLNFITRLMLERNQYSNIPILDIPDESLADLGALLGEDIIVRKDLGETLDMFGNRVEVINFTFDEFRDFLISTYLMELFRSSKDEFEGIMDVTITEQSPVAEGVRAYLYFSAKQPGGEQVLATMSNRVWFKELFIKSIFSVEESLITDDDIKQVSALFFESSTVASWVLRMLVARWNTTWYPRLNINHLFQILTDLDGDSYDRLVRPGVSGIGLYGYDGHNSWNISRLSKELSDELENGEALEDAEFHHLVELLIFFFPVYDGRAYSAPALDAFRKFSTKRPEDAVALLSKYTQLKNVQITSQVWRMFGSLTKTDAIPIDIVEVACNLLLEKAQEETPDAVLLQEIVRFLETYAIDKNLWYHELVVSQMEIYTLNPFFYLEETDDESHDSND